VQPNGPIVFETQTKSGGNQFHGEAYLTARNHIFNSNDAYNKEFGLPRADRQLLLPGFQYRRSRRDSGFQLQSQS
jgi:hypothetical protein